MQESEAARKKEAQLLDQEAEMMKQVLELSLREEEAAKERKRKEEMETQIAMEKARIEAENAAALQKKNEELDELKAQLADAKEKHERELAAQKEADLQAQRENLKQAMADLKVETEGSATEKILAKTQTQFHADETFDDRKQKLKNYQQKTAMGVMSKVASFGLLASIPKMLAGSMETFEVSKAVGTLKLTRSRKKIQTYGNDDQKMTMGWLFKLVYCIYKWFFVSVYYYSFPFVVISLPLFELTYLHKVLS